MAIVLSKHGKRLKSIICKKCSGNDIVHQSYEYSQENLREEHFKCNCCSNKWIIFNSIH